MLQGVPDHVDGLMLGIVEKAGGRLINQERMWHYPEGIANFAPVWNRHAIRILSGPSPLWLDAQGRPLPAPLYPGFDTLGALRHIVSTGYDHSWFVLNHRIARKEFALSGSEQNPDLTGGKLARLLRERFRAAAPAPVRAFLEQGEDFVRAKRVRELAKGMNRVAGDNLIDPARLERLLLERDREVKNRFGKDSQLTAIRGARAYIGDRLSRVASPHAILDPAAGPLIAVRLSVLTRKSLGGIETDLSARVLKKDGQPLPGLFAAGEAAGFGGGGMHGYRALESTFLGGCLFPDARPRGARWDSERQEPGAKPAETG